VKVSGTGSPIMLTICVGPSDVRLLREELEERRSLVIEALVQAPRLEAAGENHAQAERHEELVVISRALDELREHVPRDQPRTMTGPTWLLDPVIRSVAGTAVEQLCEAVETFASDRGRVTPDELRAVLDTACRSTAALIALDHEVNFGVDG
jgi:hypothetical protein